MGRAVNPLAFAYDGSNPSLPTLVAHVAQGEERILGKDEVTGSNPVVGFRKKESLLT